MSPRLSKARESIGALRAVLLWPTAGALPEYLPALAAAVESLSTLESPTSDEAKDLSRLRNDLAACLKLIEHGLATTRILAGILTVTTAGYSPTGRPRPFAAVGKVSLEG